MKHNLLNVSQICDQGNEVVFISKNCVVQSPDIEKTIIKGTRTLGNVFVLEGSLEHCYLRKSKQGWLWHKILRHLRFIKLHNSSNIGGVCDFRNISLPENTI